MSQTGLGFDVRILRLSHEEVTLRATAPELRDNVALGHKSERLGPHFVIKLECRFGLTLLEMNVAKEFDHE